MSTQTGSSGTFARIQALIAAIQQAGVLPTNFSMPVDGVSYSITTLAAKLGALGQPLEQEADAKAAAKTAEGAAKTALPIAKAFLDLVEMGFKVYFGPGNQILLKLDIKPKAPPKPLTSDQVLQRKLKAAKTREMRGTMSAKAKKALKATSVPATNLVVDDTGVHVATTSSAATSTTPASSAAPSPAGTTATTPAPSGS